MGKNANDNRSNSLNPNNAAYQASERNRQSQLSAGNVGLSALDVEEEVLTPEQRAAIIQAHSEESRRGYIAIAEALLASSKRIK